MATDWIESTLASLSLEEKVGQIMVVGFWNYPQDPEGVLKRIRDYHLGGFFHFSLHQEEVAEFARRAQEGARIPLFVTCDYEEGTGRYVREGTTFPRPMSRGHAGTAESEYEIGKAIAREATALGVNYTLSPVVDVNTHPFCPDVNTRAYSDDPERVGLLASAYLRGLQENGVIATAKHFPGNGGTHMDQHISPAIIDASAEEMEAVYLRPFREAIAAGVQSIMVAHLEVPALCRERHPRTGRVIPASLSREVITDLLKGRMGFEGMVISDALDMGGVAAHYTREEANLKALQAGTDVLLDFFPLDFERDYISVIKAVEKGDLPMERLDDAVRRVLHVKERFGLCEKAPAPAAAPERETVFVPDHNRELCEKVAGDGLTLLRNARQTLPLSSIEGKRVLVYNVFGPENKVLQGQGMFPLRDVTVERLRERGAEVEVIEVVSDWPFTEMRNQYAKCREAEHVFVNFYLVPSYAIGTMIPNINAVRLFYLGLLAEARNLVITAFGDPYVMSYYPTADTCLFAFDESIHSQEMAVRAWFGEVPVRGRMPVHLEHIYERGDGLDLG